MFERWVLREWGEAGDPIVESPWLEWLPLLENRDLKALKPDRWLEDKMSALPLGEVGSGLLLFDVVFTAGCAALPGVRRRLGRSTGDKLRM